MKQRARLFLLLALLGGLGRAPAVLAAACTTAASGAWATAATWNAPCNVAGGPGAGDTVTIGATHTVTLNASAAALTVTVAAATAANGITLNGFTLNVGGDFTMTAVSTNNITSTVNVGTGALVTKGSITINGGAANRVALMTVSSGTITCGGSINFAGTAANARLTSTGNSTINVAVNLSSGGTLTTGGTGTINFNGSANQNIGVYATYNNVAVNSTGGVVSFLGNATIGGALTVTAGTLTSAAGTLNVTGATSVSGTFNVGNALTQTGATTVNGTLNVSAAAGAKTFIGLLTISGTWNNSGNSAVTLRGGLTHNGTTFTAGTGVYTFNTNSQNIGGTSAIIIPSITVTAVTLTLTNAANNSDLTVTTALAGTGGLTNGTNSKLHVKYGGAVGITTLTATASGNLVEYSFAGAQTVKLAGTTYYNLTLSGSGAKTVGSAAGQTLTVAGDLAVGGGVTYDGTTRNPAVSLAGDFANSGTFNSGTGIFTFSGTGPQTLDDTSAAATTTFTNMTMNNTGASPWLTVNKNITVSTTLTFTNGGITTGTNTVILPATGSVARTSGYVAGNLQKNVAVSAGAISRTFEIGDATVYAPINVTFAKVTVAGNLIASTTTGDHPNTSTAPATSGIDANNSVNRYWTMTNSGITFTTYNATFNYVAGDDDGTAIPAKYVVAKGDACSGSGAARTCTTWTIPTAGAPGPSSTQATATGMANFSDFAVGQRSVNNFLIGVSGPASTCSASPVTITARDSTNSIITNYAGTVTLSTSASHGDWSKSTAQGTLTPGSSDTGTANYTFVSGDNGAIILNLTDTHADTLTVTVTDAVTGASSTSAALSFQGNAFTVAVDPVQVAGRNQAMTATMMIGGGCGIATTYTGAKNLDAWLALDPSDPGGAVPKIGALSLPTSAPASNPASNNLTLTFANGVANFNLSTTDVGKYVLNVRDDTRLFATGTDVSGASSTITTRPFALGFTNIQQGALVNPGGTAAGGAKFVAAEDTFQATVGAYLWQAADDVNNDGNPDAGSNVTDNGLTPSFKAATTLSATTPITPAGGSTGTLGGSVNIASASFAGGAATVVNLTYNQVGSTTLSAVATNYLNSGITLTGSSAPVGRFYPDHLSLTASTLAAACNGFTYMDQPGINISLTLQAQGKSNGLMSNYDNNTLGYPAAAASLAAENANAGTDLGVRITSTVTAAKWVGGQLSASSPTSALARNATPDGAYDALAIGVKAVDTDGAVIANRDMNAATTGSCAGAGNCDAKQLGAGTTMVRFGRLRLQNASGSQLIGMPMPISAQYWNGSGFVINMLDNCTSFTLPNVTLGNYQGLSPGDSVPTIGGAFSAGVGSLKLSAPGSAKRGSVDVTVDLAGAGQTYLQGAWSGTTYTNNPTGRATFGVYRNTDRLIHQQENY